MSPANAAFFAALVAVLGIVGEVKGQAELYQQCGGIDFNGASTCVDGATCYKYNEYYSQCIPISYATTTPAPPEESSTSINYPSFTTPTPGGQPSNHFPNPLPSPSTVVQCFTRVADPPPEAFTTTPAPTGSTEVQCFTMIIDPEHSPGVGDSTTTHPPFSTNAPGGEPSYHWPNPWDPPSTDTTESDSSSYPEPTGSPTTCITSDSVTITYNSFTTPTPGGEPSNHNPNPWSSASTVTQCFTRIADPPPEAFTTTPAPTGSTEIQCFTLVIDPSNSPSVDATTTAYPSFSTNAPGGEPSYHWPNPWDPPSSETESDTSVYLNPTGSPTTCITTESSSTTYSPTPWPSPSTIVECFTRIADPPPEAFTTTPAPTGSTEIQCRTLIIDPPNSPTVQPSPTGYPSFSTNAPGGKPSYHWPNPWDPPSTQTESDSEATGSPTTCITWGFPEETASVSVSVTITVTDVVPSSTTTLLRRKPNPVPQFFTTPTPGGEPSNHWPNPSESHEHPPETESSDHSSPTGSPTTCITWGVPGSTTIV